MQCRVICRVTLQKNFSTGPRAESFEDLEIENVLNTPKQQFGKHVNILTFISKIWIKEVKLEQN